MHVRLGPIARRPDRIEVAHDSTSRSSAHVSKGTAEGQASADDVRGVPAPWDRVASSIADVSDAMHQAPASVAGAADDMITITDRLSLGGERMSIIAACFSVAVV
jgi:hypothetical protein